MSGLRAARKLRTGSAGAAPAGPRSSTLASALLAAGESEFQAKFASFKGSARASKASSALQAHRRAWMAEAKAIAKTRRVLEADIAAVWSGLQMDVPGVYEATSERDLQVEETRKTGAELMGQTQRAKAMLRALRVQRRAEREQETLQPTPAAVPAAAAPKKKLSTAAAAAAATAAANVAAAASAEATAAAAARAEPLSKLLSSLSAQLAHRRALLTTEEQILAQQLQPLQDSLASFESNVDLAPAVPEESRLELAADDQIEQDEEPEASPLEALRMPGEEGEGADEDDSEAHDTVATPIEHQRAFLTQTQTPLSDDRTAASMQRPRSNRSTKTAVVPGSARSSSSASSALTWPPLPALDAAVAATLPAALIESQRVARAELWQQARADAWRGLADHESQLSALRDDFARESAHARRLVAESDRALGSAWTADAQARLKHLAQSYRTRGQSHAQLIDRLRLEFAAEAKAGAENAAHAASVHGAVKSASTPVGLCLSERVDLLDRARALSLQRASLSTAFALDQSSRVAQAILALASSDRAALDAYHRSQSAQAVSETQAALHAELSVLRGEKAERDRIDAEAKAAQDALDAEQRAIKDEQERVMREQQKQLIALYHAHTAAEAAEAAAAQARARAEALDASRAEIEARKPLVERRQELIAERKAAQARREEEAASAVRARDVRLSALRALVMPLVERDPARLLAATAASSAEDSSSSPLFSVSGYDMNTLLKDKRFRLQLALWSAGMHQTDYGKQAVSRMPPNQQPRRDMQSNVFPSRPM